MEAHARAPDPLTSAGNMANNWRSWKEDFIIFMKVTGYIDRPNEARANLLKNRIGKIGLDVIQNMSFDKPQDKDDMDILIKKLEEHFDPPKKEVMERYHFFTRIKKQNESIEQYINSLRVRLLYLFFSLIRILYTSRSLRPSLCSYRRKPKPAISRT